MLWGTEIEIEKRNRFHLLMAACAYEIFEEVLIDDIQFDTLALKINLSINTNSFDNWWIENFEPHTGIWIWTHPELDLVKIRTQVAISNSKKGHQHDIPIIHSS